MAIKKLLLIRLKDVTSDLLDKALVKVGTEEVAIRTFVVGEPIPVSPTQWHVEGGLSHYAYALEMKLKQWLAVKAWNEDSRSVGGLLLEIPDKGGTEKALASVGLRKYPEDDE